MGAGSGGAGRGRDPPHEHGPRRNQGRLRPRADACRLRRGDGAGDRLRRGGNARALPRGAGRWPGGRGAGGVALPLRHPHHRRDQALSRRARRPGAAVTPDELTYDARGLIPAVVQEAETGEVLMLAWMDRDAVAKTLTSGVTHFWSRSRQAPWQKGETSGHVQHVQGVYADCDGDTLVVQVHQEGVACHTGARTCFFNALSGPGAAANMLERIERIVGERKSAPASGSYVAGLLAKGEAAVCRKIGEEAIEVVTAAPGGEGGAPGGPAWNVVNGSRAELELRRADGGAGMLAHATCRPEAARRDFGLLERHLLLGLRDRATLEEDETDLGGRRAAHRVVEGRPRDGEERMRIESYVLKDARCVYDLLYVAPPDEFDGGRGDFRRVVQSFVME